MRAIVTITVDRDGNLTVNYSKSLRTEIALQVIKAATNIIEKEHRKEVRRKALYINRKYKKLIEKQKPELN
jgi:hypothetical protein